MKSRQQHCFICENIEKNTSHLLDSTLKLWQADPDFRELYSQQPYICLPHYGQAHGSRPCKMPKKNFQVFQQETDRLRPKSTWKS